jgi:hypothetical protein
MSLLHPRTTLADLPELDVDAIDLPVSPFDAPDPLDAHDLALYAADAELAAMRAERAAFDAAEAARIDPDAERLLAEYAAQQRERAANASDYAPTDAEIASDPEISAILDDWRAGDIDWLAEQVEEPEHFTIATVGVAA